MKILSLTGSKRWTGYAGAFYSRSPGTICPHFLTKICDMDPDIPAVVIRTALSEKGIVFGLVPDEDIDVFIRSSIADSVLFCVARGRAPYPCKDTRIAFFFDSAYLKSSGMNDFNKDDSGKIDAKAKSARTLVEKETVLAEKIAGTPPKSGKDVFGKAVSATGTSDVFFRAGTGAVMSQDGQNVSASSPGDTQDDPGRIHRRP